MLKPAPSKRRLAKRTRLQFHPICLLFPELPKQELDDLAADIKEKGLFNAVVLYEGKILDGRNRYKACEIAGVEPRFVEWSGGSPLEWVVSENLVRRHLSSSQRAILALDLLPLLEKEAARRQRLSGGRGKKVAKKLAKVGSENGKSSKVAARMTKTNSTYIEAAKQISRNAPEVLDKVRSGVLKIPDATKVAKLSAKERKRVLGMLDGQRVSGSELHEMTKQVRRDLQQQAAKAFARKASPAQGQGILVGSMELLWDRLEDNSVDLFLTDPPYAQVELYEQLAELAAAKLKPGKLCLAYSGQLHLATVMQVMSLHLSYWWTFAIEFSGSHCAIHPRKIQNKWKPILVFAKPPLKPAPEWLSDHLAGGGRDKEYHDWGQDESEVEYLINRLTRAGDLIVDPFCGGGAIPAACKSLGRRWLAAEIDKATAMIARKRLGEM
ncbi:MAG: DNA methyltransferase [Pirellulaceae bacterium]